MAEIREMGIRYDRQWMVVDESGMFVAQRGDKGLGIGIKSMCLIETKISGDWLHLFAPDMPRLSIPLCGHVGEFLEVQVWKNRCLAEHQGLKAARWFTKFLSRERPGNYCLVRMSDDGVREGKYSGTRLAFADAEPFLFISQASLRDLNERIGGETPLPMDRFRPNIVLVGCEPYEEDSLSELSIVGVHFVGSVPCKRCPITTTDQLTGERGKEPLRTLATYRKVEGGVIFGMNFSHRGNGIIAVGDKVRVISRSH